MRTITLYHDIGSSRSLTVSGQILLTDPAGLGFAMEADYAHVGGAWVRQGKKRYSQEPITGQLIVRSYAEYQSIVQFMMTERDPLTAYSGYSRGGFYLGYSPMRTTYYRDIDVLSLGKGELGAGYVLTCPITFMPRSRWYLVNASTFSGLTWSNVLANNGHFPMPWRLELTVQDGQAAIQELEIYCKDASRVQTLASARIATPNGFRSLIWDARDGYANLEVDGSKAADLLDPSFDNFFKIPLSGGEFGMAGNNSIRVTGAKYIYTEFISI